MDSLFPKVFKPTAPIETTMQEWWTAFDEDKPAKAELMGQFTGCPCGAGPEELLHEDNSVCLKCGEVLGRLYDTTAE
jgi:hypothetical protein